MINNRFERMTEKRLGKKRHKQPHGIGNRDKKIEKGFAPEKIEMGNRWSLKECILKNVNVVIVGNEFIAEYRAINRPYGNRDEQEQETSRILHGIGSCGNYTNRESLFTFVSRQPHKVSG